MPSTPGPGTGRRNAGGITPVIVKLRPSSVRGLPMMSESAPRRRHSAFEITAPWSSTNHCPTIGLTPRLRASDGVTSAPDDVLRLARERHVEAGGREPAEHVEALRALLVLLEVGEGMSRPLSGSLNRAP